MVYANRVYVGVSAGTIIAARDISTATLTDMATDLNGLALINAYVSVDTMKIAFFAALMEGNFFFLGISHTAFKDNNN